MPNPDDMLSAQEVSDAIAEHFHMKMSLNTLAVHRHRGSGPIFHRIGNPVYYKWSDVTEWLARRLGPRRYSGRIVYIDAA
jgi:hypothetical protein